MRSAFSYLLLTRLKNQLLGLLKSPGKLIYAIIILALIAVTIFSGNAGSTQGSQPRNMQELHALLLAVFALVFIMIAKNGFTNGANMFTLPDTNLLFTAPVKSQSVLFYGLIQQIGMSLLLGLFILFQYAWLHMVYGINYGALLVILLGYALTVFCAQLTAMVIYSFTSANERRKRIWKIIFLGIIFAYIAALVLYVAADRLDFMNRAVNAAVSLPFQLFPIAGWNSSAIFGAMTGDWPMMAVGLTLCLLYVAALVIAIIKSNPDYYEDVLKTAEISYNAITAKKQGLMGEALPKNVKVGKTGMERGKGATAFYYKHLIENRRSRMFILDTLSLIYGAVVIAFSFFMREVGIAAIFIFATYMQVFSVSLGRINKELIKPYVYLVPEPPFQKLINCLREGFSRILIEAVVIFVPVAFILQLSPVTVLFCIIARCSFGLLFTSGNILVERVFGTVSSKILVFTFYFLSLIVIALPGIALAITLSVLHVVLISDDITILLSLTLGNLPVSALVMYLCRNMLEYAELNNR